MAKESVPATSEVTRPPPRGEIRRYSAGKATAENSDKRLVPHYLRASTGSCHDFCKYGKNHAFEEKEKRSIPNRATRKKLYQSSEESIARIMMSAPRLSASVDSKPTAKNSTVKPTESVKSESQISDIHIHDAPAKSFDGEKLTGNEIQVNRSNKISLLKAKPSLLKLPTSSSSLRQETSSSLKGAESPSKSISRKVENPSKLFSKKAETSPKSTSMNVGTQSKSTSKKVETQSKSTSKKVEAQSKSTYKKVEAQSKSTSKVKTSLESTSKMVETSSGLSSFKGKQTKLSEKRVISLNPVSSTRKTILSSKNSSKGIDGGKRSSEIKMEAGSASSKSASRKLMTPLRASLSPKPSLKRVASLNSRKHKSLKITSTLLRNPQTSKAPRKAERNPQTCKAPRKAEPAECINNEVEEKTLYVIKMESGNNVLQSDQNENHGDESSLPPLESPQFSSSSISQSLSQENQEESEYTTSEYEEDSVSGNQDMENGKTLEEGKPRKDGMVSPEDKDSQMLKKLKFRRGKVVDNQIVKNSPRRLKFRRGRGLGENSVKTDAQRKSFRDGASVDGTDATTGPETVVLRHQDMQDKKDAQGLFNNVIEETASKLVETRKSKVKALVGAFETVISLQEKKPSANTVS